MTPAPKSAALIVLLIATLSTHEAAAQLVTWDGNGASPPNGIFSNALNWNPNQVPGLGDTVFFSANDTYTVTFVTFQANGTTAILGGTVSWLSNSATTQQYGIVNLVAGGGQSLTIGSSTKPVAVTVGAKILLGTGATSLDGTVNVVGANSVLNALDAGQTHELGNAAGYSGTLRYQDGAQGAILGTINIGASANVGSNGLLEVLTGADLVTGSLNLATTSSTSAGMINITGAGSSLAQIGAATLTVGRASGVAATININTGATFISGSGPITVNATGSINCTEGGVFNANGNLSLNGGQFFTSGGSFSRGATQALFVQNGGLFNLNPPDAGTNQNGLNGATLTTAGFVAITSGTVRLEGGRGGAGSVFQAGRPGGNGGVVNMNGGSIELSGNALLSLDGGTGGLNGIAGDGPGTSGAGGQANLLSGALVLVNTANFSLQGGPGASLKTVGDPTSRGGNGGTLNAAGASIFIDTGTWLSLNGGLGGQIETIGSGGHGGPGGTLNLTAGSIIMNGGSLTLAGGNGRSADLIGDGGNGGAGGTLTVSAGELNVSGGIVSVAGGAAGGAGGADGSPGSPGPDGWVNVTGGDFVVDGGQVLAGTLQLSGVGVLDLNGGTFSLKSVVLGSGTPSLNFGGGTLRAGAAFSTGLPVKLTGINGNSKIDTNTFNVTFSGPIGGDGGLEKQGAGILTLSGAPAYNGTTTISGGAISIAPAVKLPAGALTLAGGGALINNVDYTLFNNVGIAAGQTGALKLGGAFNMTLVGSYANMAGTLVLDESNSATDFFGFNAGTSNGPVGSISVIAPPSVWGHLQLNGDGPNFMARAKLLLPAAGSVYVQCGNTVSNSVQIGALDGGNLYTVIAADNKSGFNFIIKGVVDGSFAGSIRNGALAGANNLLKTGASKQELIGLGITYTGTTRVDGGTLKLTDATAFASSLVILNGGSLELANTTATPQMFVQNILGGGNLAKSGSGTITLTGALNYLGDTNVLEGTLNMPSLSTTASVNVYGASTLNAASITADTLRIGGVPPQATAVPEPSALALLALAGLGLWLRHKTSLL